MTKFRGTLFESNSSSSHSFAILSSSGLEDFKNNKCCIMLKEDTYANNRDNSPIIPDKKFLYYIDDIRELVSKADYCSSDRKQEIFDGLDKIENGDLSFEDNELSLALMEELNLYTYKEFTSYYRCSIGYEYDIQVGEDTVMVFVFDTYC